MKRKFYKPVLYTTLFEAEQAALAASYRSGDVYNVYQTTDRGGQHVFNIRSELKVQADKQRGYDYKNDGSFITNTLAMGFRKGLLKDLEPEYQASPSCAEDVRGTGMWPRYVGGLK